MVSELAGFYCSQLFCDPLDNREGGKEQSAAGGLAIISIVASLYWISHFFRIMANLYGLAL